MKEFIKEFGPHLLVVFMFFCFLGQLYITINCDKYGPLPGEQCAKGETLDKALRKK